MGKINGGFVNPLCKIYTLDVVYAAAGLTHAEDCKFAECRKYDRIKAEKLQEVLLMKKVTDHVAGICGLFCGTCPECGEFIIWYETECRKCGQEK